MKKNTLFVIACIFLLSACTGKQGAVDIESVVGASSKDEYGVKRHEGVTFGIRGADTYVGKPTSMTFYAFSVSVDLKSIQEAAATKVLTSIYDDVSVAHEQPLLLSTISNFSYSWEFSMSATPSVSYTLSLFTLVNGDYVPFKEVNIKDYNGGVNQLMLGGLGGILGSSANSEEDKRSQLVTNSMIKSVYEIYQTELPRFAKLTSSALPE